MTYNLRPYQNELIAQLRVGFKLHKRQVMCAPTGSGKTVMFSQMAHQAIEKGKRVIIITDRTELCRQTLTSVNHDDAYFLKPGIYPPDSAKLLIAMVETLANRIKKGWDWRPDFIIIDEAHKGNFSKVIDHWPDVYTIGATATPVGKHFHKYYTSIVQPIDVPELISKGYLSEYHAFQMQDDLSDIDVRRGDYSESSMFNHFNKSKLYHGVVDKWKEKCKDLKTIVFCVNIEHVEKTCEEFRTNGITAECVTSKTNADERERILRAFSDGLFKVLVNCSILTTGYDEPSVECVVLNRATKSLILFLQMIGRGSRITATKKTFTVLDFGMNHTEHGRWDMPRPWKIERPKKRKGKSDGVAPVKSCPKCDAIVSASARKCTYCGFEFPLQKNIANGELVEVPPHVPSKLIGRKVETLTLSELSELQKAKKYKASFVWRIVRSRGELALNEYANEMGYSKGWIIRQKNLANDAEFTNFTLR